MKIKKLSIRGYRSLKDVTWEPGDLNVLIGPNASGKSNVLRGMELLRTAGTGDLEEAVARQGGIGSLLWDHRADEIEWKLDLYHEKSSDDRPKAGKYLQYQLLVERLAVPHGGYIKYELVTGSDKSGKRGHFGQDSVKYLERHKDRINLSEADRKLVGGLDRIRPLQTALSQVGRFSNSAPFSVHSYLEHWRFHQELVVSQDSSVRKAPISRTESSLSADGQNLIGVLHTRYTTDREFRSLMDDAMHAAFGRDFEEIEFPPAEDQRIQMRIRWKSLKSSQSIASLSEGTLRFLMLVAILADPTRPALIAIDEPEAYLHPRMFAIVAELAAEASGKSQIIFATHSPEFLTATGDYCPTATVVQNIEGETKLNVLDRKDLKRWLEKFPLGALFVSGGAEALT